MRTLILLAGACLTVARLASALRPPIFQAPLNRPWRVTIQAPQTYGTDTDGFDFKTSLPSSIKCTQLIFGFAVIKSDYTMKASLAAEQKFTAFTNLRNANLKTILEVNLMLQPTIVQDMLVDPAHRLTFIQSAIGYLTTHGFDGINILWLNANNGQVTKSHYTSFVQEFRVEIDAESNSNGPDALLLTASVASQIVDIERSYDVVPVATAVDFLNVMTSDMTGYFAQKTPSFQTPGASFQSASFAMKYWKTASALPGKLNMGIGVFGRVFTLDPSVQVEPVQGSLSDLPAGIWSRYEVCSSSASAGIWFAFDNQADIDEKVQVIKDEGLAGAFVVSMDLDDFDGNSCTDTNDLHGPYAVTDRVHAQLNPPPVNAS